MATTFPILPPDGHRGGNHQSPKPKPNAHPYAIKTTSTALLTRSNSSGHYSQTPHFYVPTSPSPSSKQHRYSKSDAPRPLPVPPSPQRGGYASADDASGSWRSRADTLPGSASDPFQSLPLDTMVLDDLPSNPRVWTTSQLASYLMTALRVRSGDGFPLPLAVTQDIAAFVKEARITGRTFLRLSEADLEQMGVDNLWRTALIGVSRNLRQNVLKGRIWGFTEQTDPASPSASSPSLPTPAQFDKSPFSHPKYNSSSSSIDEEDDDTTPSKKRGSRVRGMVATLERSSVDEGICGGHSPGPVRSPIRMPRPRQTPGGWVDEEALLSGSGSEGDGDDEAAQDGPRKPDLCDSPSSTSSSGSRRPLPLTPISYPDQINVGVTPTSTDPHATENQAILVAEEPSVTELLALTEHDALGIVPTHTGDGLGVRVNGRRWGAQAWEDVEVSAGATVKRAVLPSPSIPFPVSPSSSGGTPAELHDVPTAADKGKGRDRDTPASPGKRAALPPLPVPLEAQTTGKAPDVSIFARPLPLTPGVTSRSVSPARLGSPSRAAGSRPPSPVRLVEQGVQAEGDVGAKPEEQVSVNTPVRCDAEVQTEVDGETESAKAAALAKAEQEVELARLLDQVEAAEIARLSHTRALVDAFRLRLEEMERKLADMERQEDERDAAHAIQLSEMERRDEPPEPVREPVPQYRHDQELSDIQEFSEPPSESPSEPPTSAPPTVPASPLSSTASTLASAGPSRALRPARQERKRRWRDLATAGENRDGSLGGMAGWDPLEGGLPAYMLMVGLGVCVVVVQTVVRRWAGRKS